MTEVGRAAHYVADLVEVVLVSRRAERAMAALVPHEVSGVADARRQRSLVDELAVDAARAIALAHQGPRSLCRLDHMHEIQINAFIFVCTSMCEGHVSAEPAADDGNEADALAGRAAEVLRERQPAVRGADLARAGLLAQLEPALEDHPQAAGPDRMAEALQAAVGIHGQVT